MKNNLTNWDNICIRNWAVDFAIKCKKTDDGVKEILENAAQIHKFMLNEPSADILTINKPAVKLELK